MVVLAVLLAPLALLAPHVLASNCQNNPGVANGECVKYYASGNCNGNPLGSYKPDCSGACFRFSSFGSIGVGGDGTYGTDCHAYSDANCQNQIGDSGNHVTGPQSCLQMGKNAAQSMKCFYRC